MAQNTKGLSDVISKVRVPKRTKEATQMNEAYEPTQTAIQYWDGVERKLKDLKAGYERALTKFKDQGGEAHQALDDENDMILAIKAVEVRINIDHQGRVVSLDSHLPVEAPADDLIKIANATTAIIGLSKSEDALKMAGELRSFVENDGFISGINNLVNRTVLENSVLTALTMVPEEKGKAAEE